MNTMYTNFQTKRVGLLMTFCAALFAFILIIIPAQVNAGEGSVYEEIEFDFGSFGGSGQFEEIEFDFGYPTGGSGTYSDYGEYTYNYQTPIYSYSTPSYSYPTYRYTQPSTRWSGFGESYRPMTYVPYSQPSGSSQSQGQNSNNTNVNNNKSSSNANNNNSVTNTNNNQDINNNVNNNNISLVVYAAGATSTYSNVNDNNQQLDGYCVITPSTAEVNQDLNFMAYPTGGNGQYTYSWSGSDGHSSNVQNFTGRFGTPGYKSAYVTIRSGSQIVTKTCSTNIVQRFTPPQGNTLSAYCIATPATVGVNQLVTWTVYATGGNGAYGYSWSGTDNLFGYSQFIEKTYSYAGTKQASVVVTSAGQSTTAVCNANVGGGAVSNVTVYRQPTPGTPVSGVFLNQIPDTGINWNMKTTLFAAGLLMWSAFVAYMIIARRKAALALAAEAGISREEAFKLMNMKNKGLIA